MAPIGTKKMQYVPSDPEKKEIRLTLNDGNQIIRQNFML